MTQFASVTEPKTVKISCVSPLKVGEASSCNHFITFGDYSTINNIDVMLMIIDIENYISFTCF